MLTVQNSVGKILAYLNNLESGTIHEAINGEYTIDFIATIDELKTEFLYDEDNLIEYENDLFRVTLFEELHSEDNMLTVAVTAVHISYDLRANIMSNFYYPNATAALVMTQALLGTGFTLTGTDVIMKTDIRYEEECNSRQIITAIANNWQGELDFYRKDIKLMQRIGQNRGTDFRFGKNLRSIKRIVNRAENTVSYDIEVVQGSELEELGYYELGDTIRVVDDALNVDYEVRIVDLKKDIITGLNSNIVLGNKIKDLRSSFASTDKKISDAEARAKEASQQAYDKAIASGLSADDAQLVADEAYFKAFEAYNIANTAQSTANTANNTINTFLLEYLNDIGKIIAGNLAGNLDLGLTSILNSTGTFEHRDNMLYWQNQPTKAASTTASMWNSQGLSFAYGKNAQGDWIWKSIYDANGVIADRVTVAALQALTVEAVSILVTKLTAQTINGVYINGSEITGGKYTLTSPDGVSKLVLDSNNGYIPLTLYRNYGSGFSKVYEIRSDSGGGNIYLYDANGSQFLYVGRETQDGIPFTRIATSNGGGGQRLQLFTSLLHATGDFQVSGMKNAIVKTETFGKRLLYSEESDRLYFNTKGLANTHLTTDDKYQFIIRLNDIFLQTIELNSICPYIVNLTAYSNAHVWVKDVYDKYIIIESDKETKFAYNVQCTRKHYEDEYIREVI